MVFRNLVFVGVSLKLDGNKDSLRVYALSTDDGSIVWQNDLGRTGEATPTLSAIAPDGSLVYVSTCCGTNKGALRALDGASGATQWTRFADTGGLENGGAFPNEDVAIDADGSVL